MKIMLTNKTVVWCVLIDSGSSVVAVLSQRWDQWCAEPGNRVEYGCLLQLALDLSALPRPSKAGRKELLKDFAAEEGTTEMSRTG